MMPEPPPFETQADEVEWVIRTSLKVTAVNGEAYRACEAKHQKVVEALRECAEKNAP
jgi:hypothetical protein